jgi:hypothetical protein
MFALSNHDSGPLYVTTLPQLAYSEPVIKHAVIAIGAIQREAVLNNMFIAAVDCHGNPPIPEAGHLHRTKAMRLLYKADNRALQIETVLACAMFFQVLDAWIANDTEYSLGVPFHIGSAFKLAYEHVNALSATSLQPSTTLRTIFLPALDYQINIGLSLIDHFPPPNSGISATHQLALSIPSIAAANDWTDSLWSIDLILKSVTRYSFGARVPNIEENLTTALSTFRNRLTHLATQNTLSPTHPPSPTLNAAAEAYLSAHHLSATLILASSTFTSELAWAQHTEVFRSITSNAALYLATEAAQPAQGLSRHSASQPSLGILPPLFLVATKCRSPSAADTRQHALQLLHEAHRLERGWSSCIAYRLALFAIETEAQLVGRGRLLRFEKVDLDALGGLMRIRYWAVRDADGELERGNALVAYAPPYEVKKKGIVDPLSGRTIRGFGYAGVMPMAPGRGCHCV